jgi:branched-chain amino acid transport system permease protein
MLDFLQALGSGILVGLVYALLGLAVVIIFRASEAFNFAIGEFLVIGAFLFLVIFDAGLPLLVALPAGLLAAGIVGGLIERLTIKPLLGRNPISMTIVTIGLAYILRATVQLVFGAYPYTFNLYLPDITLELGDMLFLSEAIWAGIWSVATFLLVILFLFRTRWGVAIRATSESQAKAMAFGIDSRFILFLVWMVSAVCIAIAGIVVCNYGSVSYMSGLVGLRAIPVVLTYRGAL